MAGQRGGAGQGGAAGFSCLWQVPRRSRGASWLTIEPHVAIGRRLLRLADVHGVKPTLGLRLVLAPHHRRTSEPRCEGGERQSAQRQPRLVQARLPQSSASNPQEPEAPEPQATTRHNPHSAPTPTTGAGSREQPRSNPSLTLKFEPPRAVSHARKRALVRLGHEGARLDRHIDRPGHHLAGWEGNDGSGTLNGNERRCCGNGAEDVAVRLSPKLQQPRLPSLHSAVKRYGDLGQRVNPQGSVGRGESRDSWRSPGRRGRQRNAAQRGKEHRCSSERLERPVGRREDGRRCPLRLCSFPRAFAFSKAEGAAQGQGLRELGAPLQKVWFDST